ncbi:hypothetical protein [Moorena sp. SIO4G3]|uniref:hypothetical protein n=1 Tax=Moorena sp. SIO4G3 TaxID=2607821 RepID=UPI00142C2564|nr:hypothetical protein [Moorena sp. SIO4G3]NEO75031.1 hypothetical protein [Moorena sp. SIO4G3]
MPIANAIARSAIFSAEHRNLNDSFEKVLKQTIGEGDMVNASYDPLTIKISPIPSRGDNKAQT